VVQASAPIRYELTAANVMWSEDGTGFKERICAAYEKTAVGKALARCGAGLDCSSEKSESECGKKLLGGKKYWYRCDCRKKAPCHKEICALYESTAKTQAKAKCMRTKCDCQKTGLACDTNWRGKEKSTFKCVCK
jgi:hypothetical protein